MGGVSSIYNQAAYNLAAYNTIPIVDLIDGSGSESVSGSAQIITAVCIQAEGHVEINGSTKIAVYTQATGSETVTGETAISVNIKATSRETVTGAASISANIIAVGHETITGAASISLNVIAIGHEIVNGAANIGNGRNILPIVRSRMGINYANLYKDLEILQLIREAREDLITSGWPIAEMTNGWETEMAITAICVHVLQNTGEIDDDHAFKILRGLQTKAGVRKARQKDAQN